MCWRCSQSTIIKILRVKWSALMRGWRQLDKTGGQRLDAASFRSVLDRVDMGLSTLQVDMLMRHVSPEEDGRYDFHKVLSGKLKGSTYPADVYVGWRALETDWEEIADNFEAMDSNADGRVTHQEFKAAVLQMRLGGLMDSKVIDAILKELDPDDTSELVCTVCLSVGRQSSVALCVVCQVLAKEVYVYDTGDLVYNAFMLCVRVSSFCEGGRCRQHG